MKNTTTETSREQAMAWFQQQGIKQYELLKKYNLDLGLQFTSYFKDKIEEMWRQETVGKYEKLPISDFAQIDKTCDGKQHKEFNPDSFRAYINKFSDEDKVKCVEFIIDILGQGNNYGIGYDENLKIIINSY